MAISIKGVMGNKATIFFRIVLIGGIYHLIRDVLQIAGIENVLTEIGSRNHEWCGTYCDYVTLPFDLFFIVTPVIIQRREKVGRLGVAVVASLFGFLIMWLWQ